MNESSELNQRNLLYIKDQYFRVLCMKKRLIIINAILTSALLSSCNTIAGAGRDVQNFGNSVQNTAIRTSQQ